MRAGRVARVAAVAVLALVLVGGVTSPALAAPVPAAEWPEFEPSKNKPRQWMLNILGSVLGGAMPDKWKAEQLANAHRYNHSWEMMGAQFGTNPANPNYMGAPETYDDYIIRKTEMDIKGGANGKPMKAPATKTAKFVKGVGGAVTALTGFSFGTAIGNGIVELFGVDVDGTMCSPDGNAILQLITGADCDAYAMTQEAMGEANADIMAGLILPTICLAGDPSSCYETIFYGLGNSPTKVVPAVCIKRTGSTGMSSIRAGWSDGTWTAISAHGTSGWPFNLCNQAGAVALGSSQYSTYLQPHEFIGLSEGVFVGGVWQPGEVVEVGEVEGNPVRQLVCTIEGSDGHTYTALSESYTEEDGTVAAPVCPELPEGVVPLGVEIGDDHGNELWNEDVTDEWLHWWTTYPECRTGACKLDLVLTGGSTPVSCFDLDEQCADWFEDPAKLDNYTCIYGIHTVELAECNVYAGLFKPGRIEVGAPYSDPMTGDWSGGTNAPSPDRQALAQNIQDPAMSRACAGMASMGFDPVAWVMRPVQCALEWAFVPRPAVAELAGTQLAAQFAERAPGQLVGMVGAWEFQPSMGGCSKTVNWSPNSFSDDPAAEFVVWDLCPGSTLEFLGVISKIMTGAGFAVMVFLATRRYVSGMVDYR